MPNTNETCSNQYHFNALKLRDYLEKKCIERNIKIHTDDIKDVITNDKGIDYITGENNTSQIFILIAQVLKKY